MFVGETITINRGMAAPTENVAAEVSAAWAGRRNALLLTGRAGFTEKLLRTEQRNDGFLPLSGDNRNLHLALLDVEDCVCGIEKMACAVASDATTVADARQKSLGIECPWGFLATVAAPSASHLRAKGSFILQFAPDVGNLSPSRTLERAQHLEPGPNHAYRGLDKSNFTPRGMGGHSKQSHACQHGRHTRRCKWDSGHVKGGRGKRTRAEQVGCDARGRMRRNCFGHRRLKGQRRRKGHDRRSREGAERRLEHLEPDTRHCWAKSASYSKEIAPMFNPKVLLDAMVAGAAHRPQDGQRGGEDFGGLSDISSQLAKAAQPAQQQQELPQARGQMTGGSGGIGDILRMQVRVRSRRVVASLASISAKYCARWWLPAVPRYSQLPILAPAVAAI